MFIVKNRWKNLEVKHLPQNLEQRINKEAQSMGIVNLKSHGRYRKLVAVNDKSEFRVLKKIYKIDEVLAKFIPNDSLT